MNPSSESPVGYGSENGDGKIENPDNTKSKKANLFWFSTSLVLTILLAAVIVALVLVAIRLGKQNATERTNNGTDKQCVHATANETEFCYNKQCVQIASNLLARMDSDRDPCEDFYKFVCGNYISNNETVSEFEKQDHILRKKHRVGQQLKAIFENSHKPHDSEGIEMAKTFYKSCLNHGNQMQQNQYIYEKNNILKTLGDWPVLVGNWTEPPLYSREKQLVHIIRMGITTILEPEVKKHPEKSGQNCVWLKTTSIASGFNLSPGINKETTLKDSRDLQMMISAMAKVPYNIFESKMKTIKELKTDIPNVDWNTIFSMFPANLNVSDSDEVAIISWKQFKNIMNVFSTSSKRVVQNYLYQLLDNTMKMISPILFKTICSPSETICSNLEDQCISLASERFPQIVGAEYAATFTDEKQNTEIQILAKQLQTTLTMKIKKARWLDDKTRAHALTKIDQMITIVGYPKNSFNKTFIRQKYRNVDIKENDFFHNLMEILNANVLQNLNSLRDPVQRGDWFFNAFTVNAFYEPTRNIIVVTTAYLQLAALSPEVPAYMKYARLGETVGHEITHAFDHKGHLFNELGNRKDWWNADTYKNYFKKQECFRNQFNNITDPISGQKLDGDKTLGENMADTGGLNLAYTAYMNLYSKKTNMPRLPGLNKYTHEQLFFLIFGSFQCKVYTPEERKMYLQDEHSLNRYRVNYPLKNLREFADAFKCPKTAKMRIKNPCTMW